MQQNLTRFVKSEAGKNLREASGFKAVIFSEVYVIRRRQGSRDLDLEDGIGI
jgi:hypothetical protein